jgi:hypothetical protein
MPFDDDGAPRDGALGRARADVVREVVERHVHGAPGAQVPEVRHHQVGLERVGMVVVERGPFLEPELAAIAVVAIVFEKGDAFLAETLDDAPDDGGLAGTGASGHADDDGRRGRCHAANYIGVRARSRFTCERSAPRVVGVEPREAGDDRWSSWGAVRTAAGQRQARGRACGEHSW